MGARGNSGVILSQIVRGFAEAVAEAKELDAATIARAFRGASDAAYAAVTKPVEGTMLTVIREMAEEAEGHTEGSVRELIAAVVRRGADAVERTPELLDVLRNAGVVDAGGAGLLEIVRGRAAVVAGESVPDAPVEEELNLGAVHQELSRYRYCTVFVVEGSGLDRATLQDQLADLGDSLLVVGDPSAVKVHVHTDEPGDALPAGLAAIVAFDGSRDLAANAAAMDDAAATVVTGAVTVASKDAQLNGLAIRKGNYLGLAAGEPVAQGEGFDEVAAAMFDFLLAEPRAYVTVLKGADGPDVTELVSELQVRHPDLELEVHEGGQPHYALLVSAE